MCAGSATFLYNRRLFQINPGLQLETVCECVYGSDYNIFYDGRKNIWENCVALTPSYSSLSPTTGTWSLLCNRVLETCRLRIQIEACHLVFTDWGDSNRWTDLLLSMVQYVGFHHCPHSHPLILLAVDSLPSPFLCRKQPVYMHRPAKMRQKWTARHP